MAFLKCLVSLVEFNGAAAKGMILNPFFANRVGASKGERLIPVENCKFENDEKIFISLPLFNIQCVLLCDECRAVEHNSSTHFNAGFCLYLFQFDRIHIYQDIRSQRN